MAAKLILWEDVPQEERATLEDYDRYWGHLEKWSYKRDRDLLVSPECKGAVKAWYWEPQKMKPCAMLRRIGADVCQGHMLMRQRSDILVGREWPPRPECRSARSNLLVKLGRCMVIAPEALSWGSHGNGLSYPLQQFASDYQLENITVLPLLRYGYSDLGQVINNWESLRNVRNFGLTKVWVMYDAINRYAQRVGEANA